MRKWLVGLVAAGLCAASAWAASYTWVKSADALTEGNYVILAGQGDSAMKNVADDSKRISAEDVEVTGDVVSNPDASLVWTLAKGDDGWIISSETTNGTVYAAAPSKAENKSRLLTELDGNYTLWSFGDSNDADLIAVKSIQYTDRFLQKNNSGSYFCCYTGTQKDVRFFKADSGEFSVALVPAADFEVVEGAEATVTATAKNAAGDVTYAWTVDGTPAETDGPELALPTGTVGGPYEVVCVATDTGVEGVTATASVSYTVTAAPQAYTVTIDGDIENGSVVVRAGETELVSGEEVLEGTVLTAVAIPASRSFKVESLTVTGAVSGAIEVAEDGTFTMPGENVTVSATFAPWEGTVYALVESMDDFEAGADYLVVAGAYALKNAADGDRIAGAEVTVEGKSVETEDDSIVWTIAAGTAEGKYTLYNATADVYVSAPSYESTGAASLVEDGETAEAQWTLAIDEDSLATIGSVYDSISLQRNSSRSYFAAYKGGTKPYLFKKVGAGVFSVVLDPAEDFDVIQNEEASIAATPKNAVGDVTYAWTVDGVAAETDGPVLPLSTGVVGGPHEVVCVATDAGQEDVSATATVSYTVVAAPALYTVSIAEGIENGEIALNLDGTPIETPIELLEGNEITVVATPDDGFVLEAITVNGTSIVGDTFVLAADSVVGATFVESSTVTATYTVISKTEVETTGTVPEGSEATFECNGYSATQLTGNTGMTLTLKGYEGATIKNLTLSMHSNKSSGSGSLSVKDGETEIAAIEDAAFSDPTWNNAYSQDWVDIVVPVDAAINGDVTITLAASVKSLFCQSFTVEYEPGVPVFSVGFDKEDGFTVDEGDASSITAAAQNGEGEITYTWTSETPELNGSGAVLEIPDTLAAGEYAVTVTANDSSEPPQTATADISFEVVAPAPPPADYQVSIADGIENGTVAISVGGEAVETPATLAEGTVVTVAATPDAGYELEAILVNDFPLDGDTFTVAGDSVVSATFTEIVDYATLPFLAEGTPFTGPWQNPKAAGVTVEGLGNDYTSGDGRGARFDTTGDWLQIKFEGTPGTLSYALKGNGTTNTCVFIVQESATGAKEDWSTVATYPSEETPLKATKTEFSNELKADSRFVRFLYELRVVGNVALYDVYISNGGFSVGVDKNEFEVEQGQTATVTAEAKNGVEPYGYAWSSETTPELGGNGPELVIPGTLEPGDYAVTVTATDSSEPQQSATAEVVFTVIEAKPTYTVSIADGIENGEVSISVDGEAVETPAVLAEGTAVTVVATPAAGYKTVKIEVNGEALAGDTFTVTADAVVSATFAERGEEFVKITDLDALEEGEYVITGAKYGEEFAMLAQLSESGTPCILREETPVEIENDAIAGPDASIVWTLGKTSDGWTIHNDAIGYVAYVSGGNSAGAEEEASEKRTWTITANDGLFLLTNVGNTGRSLLFNVSSPRFACYAAPTATIVPLALYKKSGPAVFAVSVDKTGFEVAQGTADSVTASAKNGAEPYSYEWTSETEALNGVEGPELAIPDTLPAGEYAATVTATDSSAEPQTATAEVTFTVVAPLPVYTVTVAEGIENGTVTVDKTEAEAGETITVTATPAENYKLVAILVNDEAIEGNTFEIAGDSVVSAEFAEIVLYPVTVDGAIEHGSIEPDKTEAEAGETVMLAARPDDGWKLDTFLLNGEPFEGNAFAMPEGEALVSAVFVETVKVTFVPVERASDFVAGDEYLLVAYKEDAYTSAMKNAANGTRIGVDEVVIAEDGSITTDNADIVWTIRAGAEEGQYVLFSEIAGVYAAGPASAGNNAQLVADGTDALAQWKLDFSALPEVKIASVSYDGRFLQRNSDKNNKYFATYTGAQVNPLLFKKAGFSVGFDKEYGFTVEAGTPDSITATALRGTEPYSYVWTGDLEGEGATLEIPDTLAEGEYAVKVTATDSSEPPQTAEKEISFTVVPPTVRYAVTVAEGIVGGEVTVDKALAEAGETVTVTATPASGYELVAITVGGTPIEGDTFEMPAQDVVVSASFAEVVDYATLPFIDKDTPYPGPWQTPEAAGLTNEGLGSDYKDGSAKFGDTGVWMQIKFRGTPGTLSFGIKGNSVSETNVSTFVVQESADGETWTPVATFTSDDNLTNSRQDVSYTLSEDSQYVKFLYATKGAGNVGIYDVYIGEAGEPEATVTVTGETTLTLGGTFALELALENYTGEYTWAWAPETVGYVDPDTATWWWTPTQVGETEVTFSAMDGDRTIASATGTLTVLGEPALVFGGDDEGTVGTPVNFTVVAEYVADPTVTFTGFLDVPEGSSLTDADVVLDFPNVTFTPDAAGEYGLTFSAGTVGVDYVEDVWVVTVAPAPDEPEVTLVGGETTVELGDDFVLEFALSNYEGEFAWTADVGEIDEDGYFTWTPTEAGEFPVVVSAVSGEETIASATVTLTVTGEPPVPVPVEITQMEFDTAAGIVTLTFTGNGVVVEGTDDLNGTWEPLEALIDGDTAIVQMTKRFIRVR